MDNHFFFYALVDRFSTETNISIVSLSNNKLKETLSIPVNAFSPLISCDWLSIIGSRRTFALFISLFISVPSTSKVSSALLSSSFFGDASGGNGKTLGDDCIGIASSLGRSQPFFFSDEISDCCVVLTAVAWLPSPLISAKYQKLLKKKHQLF